MPKVVRNHSKGLFQNSGKGAVGVPYTLVAELSSNTDTYVANNDLGITQPANSIIKSVTFLCTEAAAYSSGDLGVTLGTAAGGGQVIANGDTDSLEGAGTACAVGIGTSTDAILRANLNGTANVAFVTTASVVFSASERTIFPEVVPAAGGITAGKFQCIIELIQF